jgi:hypothetical protein
MVKVRVRVRVRRREGELFWARSGRIFEILRKCFYPLLSSTLTLNLFLILRNFSSSLF